MEGLQQQGFWQDVDPRVKNGLIITGAIIFLAGVISLAMAIRRAKKRRDAKRETSSAEEELKDIIKGGDRPTRSDADYKAAANAIKNHLDGCEIPKSELAVVEEVIKVVKKPVDWYYLVKTFGTQNIDDCGPFGSTDYSLAALLKEQLDSTYPFYTISVGVYKDKGTNTKVINILSKYLSKIGVTL